MNIHSVESQTGTLLLGTLSKMENTFVFRQLIDFSDNLVSRDDIVSICVSCTAIR